MSQILLGPVLDNAVATKVTDKSSGKTYYKKQILPEGKYKYNSGGTSTDLDLTADILKSAVKSFNDGAVDEVPFQWGGSQGEHNNDPKKRGGTMVKAEHVPGKGVFGYFDFSANADTASYVEKYPRFGVSPQLILDHERADGKKFPIYINHVLGTSVPRMKGMSGWEKTDIVLSDELANVEIVDLSDNVIDIQPQTLGGNESGSRVITIVKDGEMPKNVELTEDQFTLLGKMLSDAQAIEDAAKAQQDAQDAEEFNLSEDPAFKAQQSAIEALQANSARDVWAAKRSELLAAGVPPAQLTLADPIMTLPDNKVQSFDLADAEGGTVKVSQKTQLLGLLESLKGTVSLGEEDGHQMPFAAPQEDSTEDIQHFLDQYGI